MKKLNKDSRIGIRINSKEKERFYKVCEDYGLSPSLLIERWINRFINNSKKNKIDFKEIYSAASEKLCDYNDYMKSQ